MTHHDLNKERLKQRCEALVLRLTEGFDAMRLQLEIENIPNAQAQGQALRDDLAELDGLIAPAALNNASLPAVPSCPQSTDPVQLQAFRRLAAQVFEQQQRVLAVLCTSVWHSAADDMRGRAVTGLVKRWLAGFAVAGVLLGGWWWTQQTRRAGLEAAVNHTKDATALQALKAISLAAWVAQQNTGRPLSELVEDMSAPCTGIDVNQTLPNHPCREAWSTNRHVIFRSSIPSAGAPMDAPSEVFFDPWGGPYLVLAAPGQTPRIVCAGPTGRLGDPSNTSLPVPYWTEAVRP